MDIMMVGIDYHSATIEYREQFALASNGHVAMAKRIKNEYNASGCIILSTCNRTEIWFSGLSSCPIDCFLELLLEDAQFNEAQYNQARECCVCKKEEEAVLYLMELGCGIHSQIFGEDQILTQLKLALQQARDNGYADAVLECLFRTAITAAKKVKTNVSLSGKNTSLPKTIVHKLEDKYGKLRGRTCMVIGNGQMGRLMAETLLDKGCEVWMTLRQFKKCEAIIPKGCGVILYDERYEHIAEKEFVFSATTSHHFTIKKKKLDGMLDRTKKYCFVDMAVPRDIESEVEELSNVRVYHMDCFETGVTCQTEVLEEIKEILMDYQNEFVDWYQFRNLALVVEDISDIAGEITDAKLKKVYKAIDLSREEQELLSTNIQAAAKKAVSKIIFGLRDVLGFEQCEEVLQALEESANNCRR